MKGKDIGKLVRTVRHLRPTQIFYQIRYRLSKPAYRLLQAPNHSFGRPGGIPRPVSLINDGEAPVFSFLNIESPFTGWNDTSHGMLYAYNLNYMDWLNQPGMSAGQGARWIDRFIDELPSNRIGLDPYPIALRSINWIKFFNRYPETATPPRLNSLYSQVKLLENKLEYHLLGNHLLEDAFALYIASNFFDDEKLKDKATSLLHTQLKEQILTDGAHYEQSPMYHCIMLDRLLDAINLSRQPDPFLIDTARKMAGHLKSIVWEDMSIPLLNDSAEGIAPLPDEILQYASQLGITSESIPMSESGYRKMCAGPFEAIVDVGNITAGYQPGHTHADTFSYELRIDGKPFVVESGITTYDKNARRQFERSTAAHNTVTPADNRSSAEVWGGFRVGRRPRVIITEDTPGSITAEHNGYGKNAIHRRRFVLKVTYFEVFDYLCSDISCISRIYLSPDVAVLSFSDSEVVTSVATIAISDAVKVSVIDCEVARSYNRPFATKVIEISFRNSMHYRIIRADSKLS